MASQQPFSSRHHYATGAKEVTVREDAPEDFRYCVLQTACDLNFGQLSAACCVEGPLKKITGASILTSGWKFSA